MNYSLLGGLVLGGLVLAVGMKRRRGLRRRFFVDPSSGDSGGSSALEKFLELAEHRLLKLVKLVS